MLANSPKPPEGVTLSRPGKTRNKVLGSNVLGKRNAKKVPGFKRATFLSKIAEVSDAAKPGSGPAVIDTYNRLLLRKGPFGGPAQHAAVKGLLGFTGGHLLSRLIVPEEDRKRRKRLGRTLSLIGGGLGLASAYPDLRTQYKLKDNIKSGPAWYVNQYPYANATIPSLDKTSADTSLPMPTFEAGELFPFMGLPGGSTLSSSNLVSNTFRDPTLSPMQKAQVAAFVRQADSQTGGAPLKTSDLVRAGVGFFGGGLVGGLVGKVLGGLGILPASAQSKLTRIGAWGGLLRATGIWG